MNEIECSKRYQSSQFLQNNQLEGKIIFPRYLSFRNFNNYPPDFNVSFFLSQLDNQRYISVDLKPTSQSSLIQTFYVEQFQQNQPKEICQYVSDSYPFAATVSLSPIPVLYCVQQRVAGSKSRFQLIMHCGGATKEMDASASPQKVHQLALFEKKRGDFKLKFRVLGQKNDYIAKVLILTAGQEVQVVEVEYSNYRVADNQTADPEVIDSINKQFQRNFVDLVKPFGQFTSVKVINCAENLWKNLLFTDYYCVSKTLLLCNESDEHMKFSIYELRESGSFELEQTFRYEHSFCDLQLIQPFGSMDINVDQSKIDYFELSYLNSVITIQSIESEKYKLLVIHLQNQSIIKLSDSYEQCKGAFSQMLNISKQCEKQMSPVNSEFNKYILDIECIRASEPMIVVNSYGLEWITPHCNENEQVVQFIKSLPFGALEKYYYVREELFTPMDYSFDEQLYDIFDIKCIEENMITISKIEADELEQNKGSNADDEPPSSVMTDHTYETSFELPSSEQQYEFCEVLNTEVEVFALLFDVENLNELLNLQRDTYIEEAINCSAKQLDFFEIIQHEIEKLDITESVNLQQYAISSSLFSSCYLSSNNGYMKAVSINPRSLLLNLENEASNNLFQIEYSQIVLYFSQIINNLAFSFHIEFGEQIAVLTHLFGPEVQYILEEYQSSKSVYNLINELIQTLLSCFSFSTFNEVNPLVIYSIISIADTIDRELSEIQESGNIETPRTCNILAKDIIDTYYSVKFFSGLRKSAHISTLSDVITQVSQSLLLLSMLRADIIGGDSQLAKLLLLKSISPGTQSKYEHMFYEANLLESPNSLGHSSVSAYYFISQLSSSMSRIKQNMQQYMNQREIFQQFIRNQLFSDQLMTICELFETILTTEIYKDLSLRDEHFENTANCVFPQWLVSEIRALAAFDAQLERQCGYFYINYSQLPSEYDQSLLYSRQSTLQPVEFDYLYCRGARVQTAHGCDEGCGTNALAALLRASESEVRVAHGSPVAKNYGQAYAAALRGCGLPYFSRYFRKSDFAPARLVPGGYLKELVYSHIEQRQRYSGTIQQLVGQWGEQSWFEHLHERGGDSALLEFIGEGSVKNALLYYLTHQFDE